MIEQIINDNLEQLSLPELPEISITIDQPEVDETHESHTADTKDHTDELMREGHTLSHSLFLFLTFSVRLSPWRHCSLFSLGRCLTLSGLSGGLNMA